MTETELNMKLESLEINPHNGVEDKGLRGTGRAYRRIMNVRKYKRLYKIVTTSYIPHAGYVDWNFENGRLVPTGKYIKYQKNSNRQQWLKRETNRRIRNSMDVPRKGNYYRRLLDYWWELY